MAKRTKKLPKAEKVVEPKDKKLADIFAKIRARKEAQDKTTK